MKQTGLLQPDWAKQKMGRMMRKTLQGRDERNRNKLLLSVLREQRSPAAEIKLSACCRYHLQTSWFLQYENQGAEVLHNQLSLQWSWDPTGKAV